MPNPGVVEFEGWQAIPARGPGRRGRRFFLVFADRTSGHASYGAGRYLYTAALTRRATVVDFNRPQSAMRVHRLRDLPAAAA